ncbi:unnamed protein product, partial [Didymodactylos carnosus]
VADRLTVLVTTNLTDVLVRIAKLYGTIIRLREDHPATAVPVNDEEENKQEFLLPMPIKWQSYTVSGAMLAHLSYFSDAKWYFDCAAQAAIVGTREYCIAKLASAEAAIEIGSRTERIQAMKDAMEAAETAPLSQIGWAKSKAQLLKATVIRFVEKEGAATAIDILKNLLDDYGRPQDCEDVGRERNVALDAAMLLAQLRRYLPNSEEPSDVVKEWLDAVPKTALLHTKAMNLRELALHKYQWASNIDELNDAVTTIKEACEIREQLGHMRGLVASLNVLGSICMRQADWVLSSNCMDALEQFCRSKELSDKHASEFDQFQARIHLFICLLRYPSGAKFMDELSHLLDYFQTKTTDDIRTRIETDFCLAMSIFISPTVSVEDACKKAEIHFNNITSKYTTHHDARLIRILGAARFNSELCSEWLRGRAHRSDPDLTRDITTRTNVSGAVSAYWNMRIQRAEAEIPTNANERLQLLLDPLSP